MLHFLLALSSILALNARSLTFKLPFYRSLYEVSTGKFNMSLLSSALDTVESSVPVYNVVTTSTFLRKPVPPWILSTKKDPSETQSLILYECSMELVNRLEDVPDGDLQVDSYPDVLESKGLHLQVVVTDTTKAVLTSDDSLLYSSHPPDPGSLLCLSDLTETRPGPRRKGRIKLVKGSNIYSIFILLFCNIRSH